MGCATARQKRNYKGELLERNKQNLYDRPSAARCTDIAMPVKNVTVIRQVLMQKACMLVLHSYSSGIKLACLVPPIVRVTQRHTLYQRGHLQKNIGLLTMNSLLSCAAECRRNSCPGSKQT